MLSGALLAIALTRFATGGRGRRASPTTPQRVAAVVLQAAGLLTILVLATSMVEMAPTQRGVYIAGATVALLWGLEIVPIGPSGRLLSRPWMARLGRVSYGTYLWHFPVIVIIQAKTDWPISVTVAAVALASTAMAALSFRLVEAPIRESRTLARRPWLTISSGLAISLIGALVIPLALDRGISIATPAGRDLTVQGLDLVAAARDGGKTPDCLQKSIKGCILVDSGPKAPRVAVVGDSHARSMLATFSALAKERGWTLLTQSASGCPWQYGMLAPREWGKQTDACRAVQKDWYERQLPEFKPDVTYLASYPFDDPNAAVTTRPADANDTAAGDQLMKESVSRTARALRAIGTTMVIVEPFPAAVVGTDPMDCLERGEDPRSCRYPTSGEPTAAELTYRSLAERSDGVQSISLDSTICPDMPMCDAVRNGMVTHRDNHHVTSTYLVSLRDEIYARLLSSNAVPSR